jgi:hypothetical protein
MSKPVTAKPMLCCDCSHFIVATMDQARRHGWKLWVGGARCKRCCIAEAERAGDPPMPAPGPMTAEQIAEHRKTFTPKVIDDALNVVELGARHLAVAYGLIGYEPEHCEVGRMAERLWTMVREGRR